MDPQISVIIPVYNGAQHLEVCLRSLSLSSLAPFECIVVNDGSTDDSAAIAERYGAKVLATEGRCGPARARNIGAESAKGSILLFIDSDVAVHPNTLPAIFGEFDADPALDALMGSYDNTPSSQNFMSQYRNLMHCFVHQHSKRQATTFWAGCGAIRREVFLAFGGFDERYKSAAIEDIELGYRMSGAGRKLALNPDIQVKHLKRWSLRSMAKADFFYRAIPWAQLAIQSGRMPNDLNLRIGQRVSVFLAFVLVGLAAYLGTRGTYFLLPMLVTFFILLSAYWLECSKRNHRLITSLMVALLGLIGVISIRSHVLPVFEMVLLCWIVLFVRHRYSVPESKWSQRTGIVVGGYCLFVIGYVWLYLPMHALSTVFLIGMLIVVAMNQRFYLFLASRKGRLFAMAAIPFHFLYFISGGLAFMLALGRVRLGSAAAPIVAEADEADAIRR